MQSALIVHSRHTEKVAKLIGKDYQKVEFLKVKKPPTEKTLEIKNTKDVVIGIGGGSVIDTAKIISGKRRSIAIPTTAAGACMTPYATIWGDKKISISAKKPILKVKYGISNNLPFRIVRSTLFDVLSHAIESYWSKDATIYSRRLSKRAIYLIREYLEKKDNDVLVLAGNLAGTAIAIAKTNVIHATSYPMTIQYKIDHGTACGMLLPSFVEFMQYDALPKLFKFNSTKGLVSFLRGLFIKPRTKRLDAKTIADLAMQYPKIKEGPKRITQKDLEEIISRSL